MPSGLKLTKIGFDEMENHNPEYTVFEEIFVDVENGPNAFSCASKWLEKQPPEARYIGWNQEVYPKYTLKQITVNP